MLIYLSPRMKGQDLVLAWNLDEATLEQWLAMYALRHHPDCSGLPFSVTAPCVQGEGIIKGMEGRVKDKNQGCVLVVSARHYTRIGPWAKEDRIVRIRSSGGLRWSIAGNDRPWIIVFEVAWISRLSTK
ncbi:MAG: hypothetical protein U5R30_11085 [Deltaproteobacteria bacterium]|nr:hypothetical protein [Deltaproteobacteria bacterium]